MMKLATHRMNAVVPNERMVLLMRIPAVSYGVTIPAKAR
jgi:hypothetical protein